MQQECQRCTYFFRYYACEAHSLPLSHDPTLTTCHIVWSEIMVFGLQICALCNNCILVKCSMRFCACTVRDQQTRCPKPAVLQKFFNFLHQFAFIAVNNIITSLSEAVQYVSSILSIWVSFFLTYITQYFPTFQLSCPQVCLFSGNS